MYHSHLPLSPHSSIFANGHYLRDHAGEAKVPIGTDDTWSPVVRSISFKQQVDVLEYSHDGTMLAAGADDTVWIFRAATGEPMAELLSEKEGEYSNLSLLSFCADDRILAVAQYVPPGILDDLRGPSRNCISLWDITTGTKQIVLSRMHRSSICTITFNPKSSKLLLSMDDSGLIVLWCTNDLNSQKANEHHQMLQLSDASERGAISWIPGPTHRHTTILVGFEDGRIEMRDIVADPTRCLSVFRDNCDYGSPEVVGITVSGDGCWFASHSEYHITVHNIETAEAVITIEISPWVDRTWKYSVRQRIFAVSTSQAGDTASPMLAFADGEDIKLAFISPVEDDSQRTKLKKFFRLQRAYYTDIALSPNGQFLALTYGAGSRNINIGPSPGTLKIYDISAMAASPLHVNYEPDHGSLRFPHFSPDGRFIVSSSSSLKDSDAAEFKQTISVWNVADSAATCRLEVIKCHELRDMGCIDDIVFLSDSRYILSVDDRGDLDLWDWKRKELLSTDSTVRGYAVRHPWNTPVSQYYALFPFTDGTLGFSLTFYNGFSSRGICCWHVETNPPGLKMLMEGYLPSELKIRRLDSLFDDKPLRVYRQISDRPDMASRPLFALIVEYQSTRRFSTSFNYNSDFRVDGTLEWSECVEDKDSAPSTGSDIGSDNDIDSDNGSDIGSGNHIGSDNVIGSEAHLLSDDHYGCVGPEMPILVSKNQEYIMNKYDKKLFLVPPAYRGPGRWHEKKLLLWKNGRMLLLDFSQVNIDEAGDVLF